MIAKIEGGWRAERGRCVGENQREVIRENMGLLQN